MFFPNIINPPWNKNNKLRSITIKIESDTSKNGLDYQILNPFLVKKTIYTFLNYAPGFNFLSKGRISIIVN